MRACVRASWRAAGLAAALAAAAGVAHAHDTWFEPLPPAPRGELLLALGTGTQFPKREFPVALEQLQTSGCRGQAVRAEPLRWAGDAPAALLLRSARPLPATEALTCWARLVPIAIEIDDATVEVYLQEIQAPPAVRARWDALRARGVRWQETYVKNVRVEIDGAGAAAAAAPLPVEDLGLDVRLETAQRPLRAGDTLRFQVLHDGQPLAGLAVELRGDLSPLGQWRRTDAEGRVELTVPLAGRWILRATDLRPAPDDDQRWVSRFVTLAFEVRAR